MKNNFNSMRGTSMSQQFHDGQPRWKLVPATRVGRILDGNRNAVSFLGVIFQQGAQIIYIKQKDEQFQDRDVPVGFTFRNTRDTFFASTFRGIDKGGVEVTGNNEQEAADRLIYRWHRRQQRQADGSK